MARMAGLARTAFEGFETVNLEVNGTVLWVRYRRHPDARAPAVLLLHGFPQTGFIWHRMAACLAANYSVVCPDLRGYGASAKPAGAPDHSTYSKRTLAGDAVALMDALGFDAFHLVGHDRGARVAHRLAVDHPERVASLCLLDISPTLAMYESTSMEFAQSYFHWFFLIQPQPLPEMLISGHEKEMLHAFLGGWGGAGLKPYAPEALAEYERAWSDPATIHANCEDYRASASIDLEHDRADRAAGRQIGCPLLVVWGQRGVIARLFDPLADWQARSRGPVVGQGLDAGHFLPEEAPEALLEMLVPHLERAQAA
jgi:haloacetate dehalogenase